MIERIHASNRSRRGFTLIELLVVMAVIAILMSLVAAGVLAWMGTQGRSNTEAELRALHTILMQHWSAVVGAAKGERLWADSDYPPGTPTLMSCSDGDRERAKILMVKLRLMEAFPINFTDLAPPPYPAPTAGFTGAECYAPTGPPNGFNPPLQLIPAKKRHYRGAYQTIVYDPNIEDPNKKGFCKPRWQPGGLVGGTETESVQSAVCLWVALGMAKGGVNVENDQLKAYMKDVDGSGNPVLADAWGTPLRFYRFSTGNSDLNASAPKAVGIPTALDSLDVNGKLLNWVGASTNSTNPSLFDNAVHKRIYTTGAAQYAVPVIVSAGPDAKFGLPAVDPNTVTFPVGSTPTSSPKPTSIFPGTTPYQDMTVPTGSGLKDEADNLYSFRKLGT